ncbi:hypothetical protein [Streptomyces sp. NBC_00457]
MGTSSGWSNLAGGGTWRGAQATALVKQFDGSGATLSTGGGHFWPYGLNYENEFSNTAADRPEQRRSFRERWAVRRHIVAKPRLSWGVGLLGEFAARKLWIQDSLNP